MIDLYPPPPLWAPPRPAIIRAVDDAPLPLAAIFPGIMPVIVAGSRGPLVSTYITTASSASNLTTYTFSSASIGTASADRFVVVATHGSGTSTTVSSVTIAGITAALAGDAGNFGQAIYYAAVPSGTTGDIVVTFSAGQDRARVGIWTITGSSALSVHDFQSDTTISSQAFSVTIGVLAGGAVIGAAGCGNNNEITADVWGASLTERYGTSVESNFARQSGASADFAAADAALACSVTWTSADGVNGGGMAVASFKP